MKKLIILFILGITFTSCNVEKTLQRKMEKTVNYASKHKLPCKCEFMNKKQEITRTLNYK